MERRTEIGWGDEIIACGQARALWAKDKRRVIIRDRHNRPRHHPLWSRIPYIVQGAENVYKPHEIVNGPGVRPYIAAKSEKQWTWKEWDCPLGEIRFFPVELDFSAARSPGVIIEPTNKAKASPNKAWGRERWMALIAMMNRQGMQPTQLGPVGTQVYPGVRFIETPDFRYACAVMAKAPGAVLPEGGLHHAAAVLNVPSVVIFGGYISPRQTGYASQMNLFTGGEPCGMRVPCDHCARAMAEIEPEMVFREIEKICSMTPATPQVA